MDGGGCVGKGRWRWSCCLLYKNLEKNASTVGGGGRGGVEVVVVEVGAGEGGGFYGGTGRGKSLGRVNQGLGTLAILFCSKAKKQITQQCRRKPME